MEKKDKDRVQRDLAQGNIDAMDAAFIFAFAGATQEEWEEFCIKNSK